MTDLAKKPFSHRLKIRLGTPFGWRHTEILEQAVVLQDERYYDVRGPGWFHINPTRQRIVSIINTAIQIIELPAAQIQTKEGIKINLNFAIQFSIDLKLLQSTKIASIAQWHPEQFIKRLAQYIQRGSQSLVCHFYSDSLLRGAGWIKIEDNLFRYLSKLKPETGLDVQSCQLLTIIAPESLEKRLENVSQRNALMEDIKHFDENTFNRGMQVEQLETLSLIKNGRYFIGFDNLTKQSQNPINNQEYTPPSNLLLGKPTERSGFSKSELQGENNQQKILSLISKEPKSRL